MLRALRRHYGPAAEIIGVMRPRVADVLAGTSLLDDVVFFDRKSADKAQRTGGVWRRLRDRRLDCAVLLTNSFRSAAIARMSRAPIRVGYARNLRGSLLTHKLYHPRASGDWLPIPAIDAYLQLAYAIGCELESPRLELGTLPADEDAADRVWRKHKLPAADQVVALNTGGAYGSAKSWPSEYFARLARRLVNIDGLSVLVTCGPDERPLAQKIVALADHPRVVSLAEEPMSIGLTKACIRRSRLLVTTDSGPRFFGVAFGVPVIALFGPTDPAWTRTHAAHEVCLHHQVPCGPCAQRTCPLGHHNCMRLLGVERVYATAQRLLTARPCREAA
jgi:heptosyltransferase-2